MISVQLLELYPTARSTNAPSRQHCGTQNKSLIPAFVLPVPALPSLCASHHTTKGNESSVHVSNRALLLLLSASNSHIFHRTRKSWTRMHTMSTAPPSCPVLLETNLTSSVPSDYTETLPKALPHLTPRPIPDLPSSQHLGERWLRLQEHWAQYILALTRLGAAACGRLVAESPILGEHEKE